MYCKNCGEKINSRFCSKCGTDNGEFSNQTNEPKSNWNTISSENKINENNVSSTPDITSKPRKPVYKKWWFWVIIAVLIIGVGANLGESKENSNNDKPSTSQSSDASKDENNAQKDEAKQEESKKEEPKEDLSAVAKEYTLTAGNYTAGVDIPSGVCDVVAVSGTGNLISSNVYNGGVNEMFGIDDGTGMYNASFNGLKLPKNTTIYTNGDLVIKLTFKEVTSNFKGRTYDENAAVQLSAGNYVAGTDFPAGAYKIVAVSGTGNISSSNLYQGGVNEVFGIDDGYGFYNNQFLNVELPKDTEFSVSGSVVVKLIPAKNN